MPGKSNLMQQVKTATWTILALCLQAEAPEKGPKEKNMPWKSSKHYGNIGVREKEALKVVENQD